MADVRIVGKKGSKARKAISEATGIKLYLGKGKPVAIINYGLAGRKLDQFFKRYPSARKILMVNKYVGRPKHLAISDADKAGILVPETKLSLPRTVNLKEWIEKKMHSAQGKGIQWATKRGKLLGKYYQRMISDRRYELRVHAFLWLPVEEWKLNKRVGPADQITWNFHQGGHYQSVRYPNKYKVFKEAKEIAKKVLENRNMAFGAVDLIVDNDMKIYFIEINSSPGFEDLNKDIYFEAFRRLKEASATEVKKYAR